MEMKTFACLLSILVLFTARAADVTFNLADFTTTAITNRVVFIWPKSTPRMNATDLILSRDRKSYVSDTNGTFTVTNMTAGYYLCQLQGPYAKTDFRIYCDDTNGTLNASDLLVSESDGIDAEDGTPIDLE
jgi:hypothetical protein